jgi:hypothetical protein
MKSREFSTHFELLAIKQGFDQSLVVNIDILIPGIHCFIFPQLLVEITGAIIVKIRIKHFVGMFPFLFLMSDRILSVG